MTRPQRRRLNDFYIENFDLALEVAERNPLTKPAIENMTRGKLNGASETYLDPAERFYVSSYSSRNVLLTVVTINKIICANCEKRC